MKKTIIQEQIIRQIEALLIQLKASLSVSDKISPRPFINQGKGLSGLTGKIHELIDEGYFGEPKTISDLQKKLKDRGTNKATTDIMPSLKRLIDKKILDRNKPGKGLYKYFKR
ncbi:MAG: hypothetical protein PHE24_03345 [Patescibacteria group bacterium]|nr:hypothetical protein [Patescibacteria group bacterium]